jgi:hypothetical protein
MKLDSKLFDRIRIQPRHADKPAAPAAPPCAWEGCDQPGLYRAPKGHRAEGEYHNFCLEHVRHYNTAFNFFAGMSSEDIEAQMHQTNGAGRPDWASGSRPGARFTNPTGQYARRPQTRKAEANRRFADPLHIWARYQRAQTLNPNQAQHERPLHEPDRRALETLGFTSRAKAEEIKKAYKSLVKIHHPDANGGDKSSEDRLRSIIAAYTHLKAKGFV